MPGSPDSPLSLSLLEENAEYRVVIPEQVLVNASGSAANIGYLLKIEDNIENITRYFSMVGTMLATLSLYILCTPTKVSSSVNLVGYASLKILLTLL